MIVALAVSGCSGGSPTTNPTPTASPGTMGGSATPTPAAGGVTSANQMFNMNNLNMYEYRLTTDTGGQKTTMTYKIEYSDSTYQGSPAKMTKMTYNMPGSGEMLVSLYHSKTDDHLLGGTYTITAGGQTMEMPIPADQGSTYSQNDWAATTESSIGDTSLANAGTDTLTANGKQYTCTKYTWTSEGNDYSVWYTAQAPMPMKYQWTDNKGNSWTMELLNWN